MQDSNYMKWALETLDGLENKILHGIFTYEDHVSFTKAKAIIDFLAKQKNTTTHYIWRTRGDGKVRSRHAKFNGEIFSWDKPPAGGYHPGEDYGCRCIAEPHTPEIFIKEYTKQTLTSSAKDIPNPWTLIDYYNHYFYKNGKPVKLHEMGILKQIIKHSKWFIYSKLEKRIFKKVRKNGAGNYPFRWNDSYKFHFREVAIGGATLTLNATLQVRDMGPSWEIIGDLNYDFYDKFTDPRDLFNRPGEDYNPEGSVPFVITDEWTTSLEAVILK